MPVYEYTCPACATIFTRLRPVAAAGEAMPCPACGAAAARTLAPFAVLGRAAPPAPAEPAAPAAVDPLCRRYPHIPLLCHMEPKAAERWIAKAEGREEQYLEREARRQEAAARAGLPPPDPPPTPAHDHHAGHVHAHTPPPGRGSATGAAPS
jgi:putative FmdB family regulatory protein